MHTAVHFSARRHVCVHPRAGGWLWLLSESMCAMITNRLFPQRFAVASSTAVPLRAEGQPVQASDTIWWVMNFHIKIPEEGPKRFQTSQKKYRGACVSIGIFWSNSDQLRIYCRYVPLDITHERKLLFQYCIFSMMTALVLAVEQLQSI